MTSIHLPTFPSIAVKARNVMLKSSGTEGRGVIAKVSDLSKIALPV